MSTDRYTQILNYLSAMSREIGEFRMETNNRLDRLETRMGGLEDRMGGLESRMGGVESQVGGLEGRLTSLETTMRKGFEQVHEELRLLEHQIETMTLDLMRVRGRQRDHEARLNALDAK